MSDRTYAWLLYCGLIGLAGAIILAPWPPEFAKFAGYLAGLIVGFTLGVEWHGRRRT